MRAIQINPSDRSVDIVELPDFIDGIRRKFGDAKPVRIAN